MIMPPYAMRCKWNGSTIVIELDRQGAFWLSAALQRAKRNIEAGVAHQLLELEGARAIEDWTTRESIEPRRAMDALDSLIEAQRQGLRGELEFLEAVRDLLNCFAQAAEEAWKGR